MRALPIFFAAGLLVAATAQLAAQREPGDLLVAEPGTIQKVSSEWWGIVPDFDEGTRYAPDELPEAFKEDGLRVVFSGVVGETPDDVRMWGTPLELTEIRRLREDEDAEVEEGAR